MQSESRCVCKEACGARPLRQSTGSSSARCSKYGMPTITVQAGQAGNQLGGAWWSLLQRQQKQLSEGLLSREYFKPSDSSRGASDACNSDIPRVISVDSEAKVLSECNDGLGPHQVHVLGHGGCGNNWACGYHFGVSNNQTSAPSWSSGAEPFSNVDKIMEGIRKESEAIEGVPDFLLMASLAGGTGSGTGSAILEVLADEYPASTIAAVAVTPGHTGDSTVQSINSCLALHHLDSHTHAVIIIDNQTLLNQLNTQLSTKSSNSTSSSNVDSSKSTTPSSRTAAGPAALPRQGNRATTAVARAPGRSNTSSAGAAEGTAAAGVVGGSVTGRACLEGVNQLAAESLAGLLWPTDEHDLLARRSNIRQLASTICADPLTKFVEICHVAQPIAAWTSTTAANVWTPGIKLLSSQLPRFDPYKPTAAVTTSAAAVIARGMPGTLAPRAQHSASSLHSYISCSSASSWFSPVCSGAGGCNGFNSSSSSTSTSSTSWTVDFCRAVCGSWPYFNGGITDVQVGHSPAALWSAGKQDMPSLTAAVRRSSTGSFMRTAAERALQLCDAGAYMHWYEQYGCEQQMIREAAYAVQDMAEGYF